MSFGMNYMLFKTIANWRKNNSNQLYEYMMGIGRDSAEKIGGSSGAPGRNGQKLVIDCMEKNILLRS